jgi:outer membrane immunogenic protein
MKRLLFAGALAFVAAGQALAADLPPPAPPPPRAPAAYVPTIVPVYNWTGFYIGGNAGYAFASNLSSTGCITNSVGFPALNTACPGTIAASSASGFAGGGQIGGNVQWNALVLGLEGDWQWSGQQSTVTGPDLSGTVKLPWFATARARVGVAADRVLFYATGGAAWIDVNNTFNEVATGTQLFSGSNTRTGWTAGAGVEWAFAQNWTARAEYLFMDFTNNASLAIPAGIAGGGVISQSGTIKDNLVRGGINFKFP